MTNTMRAALDAINENLNAAKISWLAACKVEAANRRTTNAELLTALERLIPTSAHGPARNQAEAAIAKAKG